MATESKPESSTATAGKKPDVMDYSVASALSLMDITKSFTDYASNNPDLWSTFGVMNSDLYRKKWMKILIKSGISGESIFVVHFLFAVSKKKSRVKEGLENMDEAAKAMKWHKEVSDFIDKYVVDYNVSSKNPDKFPGTHISTTNPGVDLLAWKLMTPKSERTLAGFFARTTTVQMHLGAEMQSMAHEGYKNYWTNVVKGTKNEVKTEEARYREEYYNTSAGDTYLLLDGKKKPLPPADAKAGYSKKEIEDWIAAPL